jgi:SH3 domain protein
MKKILGLACLLWLPFAWGASFIYITDYVDIPLRSDKNYKKNIIRSVPSGTKMSILQTTTDGWTQVELEGQKGWITSRYLSNNPPARAQLEAFKQTVNENQLLIAKQKKRTEILEKQVKEFSIKNASLILLNNKLTAEKSHIKTIYNDALKLEHSNEKLNTKILQLKTEIQLLNNGQTANQDASSRNWFIAGGFLLFFGILIGFIFPNFVNRRRY